MRRLAEQFRPVRLLLGVSFRVARWPTIFAMVVYPLSALSGPLAGIAMKFMIDGAAAGDWAQMQGALLGVVVALCGFYVLDLISWQLCLDLEDRITEAMETEIMQLAAAVPDLELFEREASANRLEHLRQQGWMLGRAMYILPMQWSSIVRTLFTLGLLAAIHPLLLLLPVLAVPLMLAERHGERRARDVERDTMQHERRSRSFFEFWLQPAAAAESRVFGLMPWLGRAERELAQEAWQPRRRTESANAWRTAAGWLVFGLGALAALGLVLSSVLAGERSLGTLLLAIGLVSQVSGSVSSMVGIVLWVQRLFRLSDDLLWLRTQITPTSAPAATAPPATGAGISVQGLSFRYPGAARDALSDVSLTLPAGSVVALVGENGSGKTTLVKLLCGFYEPTAGTLSVGGEKLTRANRQVWWSRVSAAFQDACKFEFIAAETVGAGNLTAAQPAEDVARAVGQAGAEELVQTLPRGLETQLGNRWPDGVGLSGGQWQQLALARGLMRSRPMLLVFDEPSASLDPQREHDLFVRQTTRARQARGEAGAITLFVTHAFSTVSMADVIVVLERGRVKETGTHAELMQRGGLYAELYSTQSRAHATGSE